MTGAEQSKEKVLASVCSQLEACYRLMSTRLTGAFVTPTGLLFLVSASHSEKNIDTDVSRKFCDYFDTKITSHILLTILVV